MSKRELLKSKEILKRLEALESKVKSENLESKGVNDGNVVEEELVEDLLDVKGEFHKSVAGFIGITDQIERRIQLLEEKEVHWATMQKAMEEQAAKAKDKIVLDVGGKRFATTKAALLSQEGTFFHAMLASGKWLPGEDGSYFIDRNSKHIGLILDFLRMRSVNCAVLSDWELSQLEEDLDFFQIKDFPLVIRDKLEGATLFSGSKTQVNQWLPGKKFQLIYKGTRDGFTEQTFANLCHNKGPTICFIQEFSHGYVFGGYNPDPWKSTPTTSSNPAAFIFTTANSPYHNMKLSCITGRNSITQTPGCLMVFGDGDISVRVNQPTPSHIQFPKSYADVSGYGANLFCANSTFIVREIEVFLVR